MADAMQLNRINIVMKYALLSYLVVDLHNDVNLSLSFREISIPK